MFEEGFIFWTAIMAIAVIVTAIIAIKKYNQYFKEKKENYFLERRSLCCEILYELNRNENFFKTLRDRGLIMIVINKNNITRDH